MQRRGLLIILSSPSGAGKSTLAQRLRDWDPTIRFSVSATTRAPRDGEVEGREYHFRGVGAFEAMIDNGDLLEHAKVFDNYYGSPVAPVAKAVDEGRDILFDIDWQGGQQIRESELGPEVVSIFVLPPSMQELERRLRSRGKDSTAVVRSRMQQSMSEISHWAEYDYVLVNDDIDKAALDVQAIVAAERLRRRRQPGLTEHVRRLNAEYGEM